MRCIALLVPFAVCCTAGCSDYTTPRGQGQSAGEGDATGAASQEDSGLKLVVLVNRVVEDERTNEVLERFPNPDAEMIKTKVKALDWTNPQLRSAVGLERKVDGAITTDLTIGNTSGPDGQLRAIWIDYSDEVPRRSPPLESLDAGIEFLLMYLEDEEKAKSTAAEWEVFDY